MDGLGRRRVKVYLVGEMMGALKPWRPAHFIILAWPLDGEFSMRQAARFCWH